MKKLFPVLLVVLTVLLFSNCNKDEDNSPSLIGTWIATEINATDCDDPDNNGMIDLTEPCQDVFGIEFCLEVEMEFTADQVTITSVSSVTDPITGEKETETDTDISTYTIDGNNITTCEPDGSDCETSTFSISGNILTVTFVSDEDGCTNTFKAEKQ